MTEIMKINGRDILFEFLKTEFEERAEKLIEKFDALTVIYNEINSIINISALKAPNDIYVKHYMDSIFPYEYFKGTCCDVGCGGGFPSIPLALVTNYSVTGIDGVGKKLNLIKRAANELNITNIKAFHVRAEEYARTNKFDTVCARAVSDIDTTLGYCAPLANETGTVVLYRTQNDEQAKPQTEKKTKTALSEVIDYTLPHTDINRRLYIYKKI